MKEKTCRSVRLGYGTVLGVFTVVVGALFIWQVLEVYHTPAPPDFVGDWHPFSWGRVNEALSKIQLFFWLWIALIVVGFVLWEVFPVKERTRKICPDLQYARARKRLPATAPDGLQAEYDFVTTVNKINFALQTSAWALFGVAVIYTIVYLAIPSNFPAQNVTHEMLNMAKHVFPCVFAGLIIVCFARIYEKYTVKSILPHAQKLARATKSGDAVLVTPLGKISHAFEWFWGNKIALLVVRIVIAVLAVAFIIWGALNGSARSVFIKAINICTECIGLG